MDLQSLKFRYWSVSISEQISKNEMFTLNLFYRSIVVCIHSLFSTHGDTNVSLQTFRTFGVFFPFV